MIDFDSDAVCIYKNADWSNSGNSWEIVDNDKVKIDIVNGLAAKITPVINVYKDQEKK